MALKSLAKRLTRDHNSIDILQPQPAFSEFHKANSISISSFFTLSGVCSSCPLRCFPQPWESEAVTQGLFGLVRGEETSLQAQMKQPVIRTHSPSAAGVWGSADPGNELVPVFWEERPALVLLKLNKQIKVAASLPWKTSALLDWNCFTRVSACQALKQELCVCGGDFLYPLGSQQP